MNGFLSLGSVVQLAVIASPPVKLHTWLTVALAFDSISSPLFGIFALVEDEALIGCDFVIVVDIE